MACGLCVVSTNVGGIPYLLEHEYDSLLVPPNDPTAMADAIRRIVTEPGLASHLSQNARQKVEQFDWSKVLPQWEELLILAIEAASKRKVLLKNEPNRSTVEYLLFSTDDTCGNWVKKEIHRQRLKLIYDMWWYCPLLRFRGLV